MSFPSRFVRATLAVAFSLVASAAVPARAVDLVAAAGLPNPGNLAEARERLSLTPEQEERIKAATRAAWEESAPLERAVREQQEAFSKLVRDPAVSPDAAKGALAKLLDAEAAVKQAQLRTLLDIRKILTAEQLKRLMETAAAGGDGGGGGIALPAAAAEKAKRLKKALQELGVPPTPAMKERAAEIEALAREKKTEAAEAAVDRLVADGRLAEYEAAAGKVPAALDLAALPTGDTDVPALEARLEAVKERVKDVVALPVLRDLLKAKAALEEAKANQDAAAAGRALTWAERALDAKE